MSNISGDIHFPANIMGIRYPEYSQAAGAGGKEPAHPVSLFRGSSPHDIAPLIRAMIWGKWTGRPV